jgi:hypothetical protein
MRLTDVSVVAGEAQGSKQKILNLASPYSTWLIFATVCSEKSIFDQHPTRPTADVT